MEMQLIAQLIIIITYLVLIFYFDMFVLWWISKRYKLKRQNLATAFVIIAITFVVSFALLLPYYLGITFPIVIRILTGIFTLILTPFLIKRFYQTGWWEAIKIYLLMLLISVFIMATVVFVISLLVSFLTPFLKMQERSKVLSQENIDECYLIQDLDSQENCFINLLIRTKDETVCDYINEKSKSVCHQVAGKFK